MDNRSSAQVTSSPALSILMPATTVEDDAALVEIVERLDSLNPTINISVTIVNRYDANLDLALSSASPPDVFFLSSARLGEYVDSGQIAKIPDGLIAESQMLQTARDAVTIEGSVYCIPQSIHTLGLVYNRDLFEEVGQPFPSNDWTWDDLENAAAATGAVTGTVGLALDPSATTWAPFYYQAGGTTVIDGDNNVQIDEEAAEIAAQFLASLIAEGYAVPPVSLDSAWSGEAFVTGNVAMTITGDWIIPYLEAEEVAIDYGIAELPRGPDRKATLSFVNCLAVNAESADEDLALQLAAQLTAPEVLVQWVGGAAEGLSVVNLDENGAYAGKPEYHPFLRSLRYAEPWRLRPFALMTNDRFQDVVEMTMAGELPPEDFWQTLMRNFSR